MVYTLSCPHERIPRRHSGPQRRGDGVCQSVGRVPPAAGLNLLSLGLWWQLGLSKALWGAVREPPMQGALRPELHKTVAY